MARAKKVKVKKRKPKKGEGVPKETPENSCIPDLTKALKKGFPKKNWTKFKTTVSANGYFEASMTEQMRMLARICTEAVSKSEYEQLIKALSNSSHEKVRGVAASTVAAAFAGDPKKRLRWLKHTGALEGTWPRELSQGSLHEVAAENGVKLVIDQAGLWANDRHDAVRRVLIEGLRPRGVMIAHIHELKDDPTPLKALLEAVLDDESDYVRKAAANNINDISKENPELVVDWCDEWMSPSASKERQWIIQRGLRTLAASGHARAMRLLGYADPAVLAVDWQATLPTEVEINQLLPFDVTVRNKSNLPALTHILIRIDEPGKNDGRRESKYQIWKGTLKKTEERVISKQVHFVDKNSQPRVKGDYHVNMFANGEPVGSASFVY